MIALFYILKISNSSFCDIIITYHNLAKTDQEKQISDHLKLDLFLWWWEEKSVRHSHILFSFRFMSI